MIIHPEVIITPDSPTVKFKQPKEQVDLKVELQKVLNAQGWVLGTYFDVQFLNHDKTELLSIAKYVVTKVDESLHTSNPEGYNPSTKLVASREAKLVNDWIHFEKPNQEIEVKWNPGKKTYQAKSGDEVLFEDEDKAKVEEYRNAA